MCWNFLLGTSELLSDFEQNKHYSHLILNHFSLCGGVFDLPNTVSDYTTVVHTHSMNAIRFAKVQHGEKYEWNASRATKVCVTSC